MTKTTYQHHDVENGAAGTYYFERVGLANYFLSLGAPKALAALRAAEKVPAEDVPGALGPGPRAATGPAAGSEWGQPSAG